MKKFLIFCVLVLVSHLTFASHIVGGVIHYECLGNNDYLITLKVYRDCLPGNSNFDNSPNVGVYEGSTLIATVNFSLSEATVTELPLVTGDPCLIPPDDICTAEAIYTAEVNLPPTDEGYILAYQRCCRNVTILNVPAQFDNLGSTFYAEMPPEALAQCNSNPSFNELPPVLICANEPFVFDHSATDLDGDSLVYTFCNPKDGGLPGVEMNPPTPPPYTDVSWNTGYSLDYPIDADPPFSIDSETGLLTGTPNQLGQYVIGICVEEYRNGVLLGATNRDFQFNIVNCGQSVIANVPDEDACAGLTYEFDNNSLGTNTYFWDFGVLELDTDTSSLYEPTYTYPDTGTYVVSLIANPGLECADTSFITIYAYEPIEVSTSVTDSICGQGGYTYFFDPPEGFTSSASYSWDFDLTADPAVSSAQDPGGVFFGTAGTYQVLLLVEDHGCSASDEVIIEVAEVPFALIAAQNTFCDGLSMAFTNLSENSTNYIWDFGEDGQFDTSLDENPEWSYESYGTFIVTLIAEPGEECADTTEMEVVILPPDPIELNYVIIPPAPCDSTPEVLFEFTGTGADEVSWDMGDGTVIEEEEGVYVYEEPGTYTVTVIANQALCDFEEQASEEVFFDASVIDDAILVPNVFSPNGDNVNDRFRVFFENEDEVLPESRDVFDYLSVHRLRIYDRWGVLLFDSDDGENTWDGTFKGGDIVDGTYYYIATYQRLCVDPEPIEEHGHFSILR